MKVSEQGDTAPWWKFGHVWLVIAGPVLVVLAGVFTAFLAVRSPDPIVAEDYYRQGQDINKTLNDNAASLLPAVQARNHAATGLPPAAAKAGGKF